MRTLDTALGTLPTERVNGHGQVFLDQAADLPKLLRDPDVREERWRRARAASASYRTDERARFDSDDKLYLESGCDLVRTLERPVEARQAQSTAAQLGRTLDQGLAGARDHRERVRELDSQIKTLEAERAAVTPKSQAAGLKLLEQAGPDGSRSHSIAFQLERFQVAAANPGADYKTLNVLTAEALPPGTPLYSDEETKLLDSGFPLWDHLDAKIKANNNPAPDGSMPADAPAPRPHPSSKLGRAETDKKVLAYAAAHHVTYAEALQAVTGVKVPKR